MRRVSLMLSTLLLATTLHADVSLVERLQVGKDKPEHANRISRATGSQMLVDAAGLEYFINTNITFSTSSSASGAASEASFTGPVSATTSGGGTVSTTLNDAFDGYNTLCLSTSTTATCETGNAAFTIYNQNGAATLDGSCSNRQVILPAQTVGNVTVQRKVFVPSNDEFARWANIFTNNGAAPETFNAIIANNLGSDSNTVIVSSSNGDATADLTDTWVSTFQNYSGTTSSDPRLGHVLQGAGAPTGLNGINFADGDDNPFWSYSVTLAPGETKIILSYVTGQASKADANAKATELAGLPANALQCLSPAEVSQVANFLTAAPEPVEAPTLSTYGAVALALMLGGFAVLLLRRRNAQA